MALIREIKDTEQCAIGDTGCRVWIAALMLARWVVDCRSSLTGKSVLELGAGCGLPVRVMRRVRVCFDPQLQCCTQGLAASLYTRQVVLTDYSEDVVQNLRHNIMLNHQSFTSAQHYSKAVRMSESAALSSRLKTNLCAQYAKLRRRNTELKCQSQNHDCRSVSHLHLSGVTRQALNVSEQQLPTSDSALGGSYQPTCAMRLDWNKSSNFQFSVFDLILGADIILEFYDLEGGFDQKV
jgi:hypothetical protein